MIINRYEQKDFDGVWSVFEECRHNLFTNIQLITRENILDYILKNDEGYSLLFCIFEETFSGFITLNNINHSRNSVFIGNIAIKSGGKQFLGIEASKWAINYCFETLNLNRVYGHTWSDNPKMSAFYKKLGAFHEGTEREHTWKNGRYVDLNIWGILRSEWQT